MSVVRHRLGILPPLIFLDFFGPIGFSSPLEPTPLVHTFPPVLLFRLFPFRASLSALCRLATPVVANIFRLRNAPGPAPQGPKLQEISHQGVRACGRFVKASQQRQHRNRASHEETARQQAKQRYGRGWGAPTSMGNRGKSANIRTSGRYGRSSSLA